jgi:hypothetical protein
MTASETEKQTSECGELQAALREVERLRAALSATQRALREVLSAVTELAEVVRDLDPGKVQTYRRVETALESARRHLVQAEAFES